MVLATLITLGGMAAGAVAGASAASEREKAARRQFGFAGDYLEALEDQRNSTRDILAGNLSLGAMSANAESENAARTAAAYDAEQATALGSSGLSGGTPFYKLDSDIINRRNAVIKSNMANRTKMGAAYLEAVNALNGSDLEEMKARAQLMDAGGSYAYAKSGFAKGASILTGAFSGGQIANQAMGMGVQSGLLTEEFLATDLSASVNPISPGYTGSKGAWGSMYLGAGAMDAGMTSVQFPEMTSAKSLWGSSVQGLTEVSPTGWVAGNKASASGLGQFYPNFSWNKPTAWSTMYNSRGLLAGL